MQLQSSCSGGRVDNSPLKQALEILTVGQQHLDDRIHHEMSTEEQLALAYLIFNLNQSIIACKGSLEQLQSSPHVAAFVALILSLCECPRSQGGDSQLVFSPDVFPHVVSALSSIMHEHRVPFVHNATVMEALDTVGVDFLEDIPLGRFEQNHSSKTLLKPVKGLKVTFNLNSSSDRLDNQECQEEGSKTAEEWKGKVGYSSEGILLLHSMINQGFVILSKQFNKLALGEGRDGYKTITSINHVEVVNEVVSNDAGSVQLTPVHDQSDTHALDQSDTHSLMYEKKEGLSQMDSLKQVDLKMVGAQERNEVCQFPANPNVVTPEGISDIDISISAKLARVTTEVSITEKTGFCSSSRHEEVSSVQCPPPIPPNPPPPTWCWKIRVQSLGVEAVERFIEDKDLSSLEEPDTECHETICHAIVCVFDAESAVSLVHALSKRSLKVFKHCDNDGNTPLHIAVKTGNERIIKAVRTVYPSSLHAQNNDHHTPLVIVERILKVLKHGEDENYQPRAFVPTQDRGPLLQQPLQNKTVLVMDCETHTQPRGTQGCIHTSQVLSDASKCTSINPHVSYGNEHCIPTNASITKALRRKQAEARVLKYRLSTSESDCSTHERVYVYPKKIRRTYVCDNDSVYSSIDSSCTSEDGIDSILSDSEPQQIDLSCGTSTSISSACSLNNTSQCCSPYSGIVALPTTCVRYSRPRIKIQVKLMGVKAMLAKDTQTGVKLLQCLQQMLGQHLPAHMTAPHMHITRSLEHYYTMS